MDYHGLNLDGVANYASGYREKRGPLKRIIETAKQNPDGSYTYMADVPDQGLVPRILTQDEYQSFLQKFQAMPDTKELWDQANKSDS